MHAAAFFLLVVAQETEPLAARARAYARDRGADAKAEILRHGPAAIRVLHDARLSCEGAEFDALSDLIFTLRFRDARDPRSLTFRDHLASRRLVVQGGLEEALPAFVARFLRHRHWLRQEDGTGAFEVRTAHVLFDPVACPRPSEIRVRIPAACEPGKLYAELDRALGRHRLDWAFRYGLLLVSTPARLWPALPAAPLAEAGDRELRRLIEDLDAAGVETRAQAAREIPAFGGHALPLLRAVAGSSEAKLRAAELLSALEPRYGDQVWDTTCGMDRQTLEGADRKAADALDEDARRIPDDTAFMECRLDAMTGVLSRYAGVDVECAELVADLKITLDVGGLSIRDALLLTAKSYGLDLTVKGGRVVVDRK